jgi:hypothetical protein
VSSASSARQAKSLFDRFGKAGLVVLAAAAFAGCGAAQASSGSTQTTTTHTTATTSTTTAVAATTTKKKKPSAADRKIDSLLPTIETRYQEQVHGPAAVQALHSLATDPTLLRLLAEPNLSAARSYIHTQYWGIWYHWHVSRMRIMRGSQTISTQGVPFVLPTIHTTMHAADGRSLGTVYVSMQDEIGFVRLMHREYPVQVVIRGSGGELRTSMYSAAFAKLPSSGSVRLGGQSYVVRSFHEPAWGGETVTIWILMRG